MYKFDPKGEPPEAIFRAIALDQLDEALADFARPEGTGRSVIHEARRRCKKLRALLRLVRPGFPEFALENAALRDAAASLSHLRDAEVLRHTILELHQYAPEPALDRLARRLAAEAPPPEMSDGLAAFGARLRIIRRRAEHWSLHKSAPGVLIGGLRRTYRTGRRRMQKAFRIGSGPAFHEWRKAVKDHGYHVDLLKRSAPEVLPAESALADRLATLLGVHHDLMVLGAALAGQRLPVDDPADGPRIALAIARRRQQLEADAALLGRQVFAERPRALARRFASYWHSAS